MAAEPRHTNKAAPGTDVTLFDAMAIPARDIVPLRSVWSGGQTGADRAGLDAALEVGFAVSGYCPKGRLAKDGIISSVYPLIETQSKGWTQRTRLNVQETDATLVLYRGAITPGSQQTIDLAIKYRKPYLPIDLDKPRSVSDVIGWLRDQNAEILNIAGSGEKRGRPVIYNVAKEYLVELFQRIKFDQQSSLTSASV